MPIDEALRSPVIVLGMHRSGTTFLARLLAAAGVFMGRKLSTNFESTFFQRLNRDMLDLFGCSWAHLEELPKARLLRERCQAVRDHLGGRLERKMGPEHFGRRDPVPLGASWGWKDPRTCLTLPLYQEFFPNARIVFICRNPRDVAMSLIVRQELHYGEGFRFETAEARRLFLHYLSLWENYNLRALEGLRPYRSCTAVRYEDFVHEPARWIWEILDVLGLTPTEELESALGEVRIDRVRAFSGVEGERFLGLPVDAELYTRWYGESPTPILPAGHSSQ